MHRIVKPFLVGFDGSRKVGAASRMTQVEDCWENLCVSSERHRLRKGDEFLVKHDLYSLDVLLIELGLCISFQDRVSRVVEHLRDSEGKMKSSRN